jgi:PKHD-type hydroxylase
MKGEWCYYNSYFSPEQCEYILETAKDIPAKMGALGEYGNNLNEEVRKSKVRFIHKENKKFSFLFDEMWKLAIKANDEWFGIHISKLDFVQLAEYDSSYGGEYKTHHDVFWMNNDPYYHRKITAIIQLTDPNEYEGGDVEIVDCGEKPNSFDIRNQGTVLFIPSLLTHKANKVTKGTRYSIAAWFDGPKWR